MLATLCTATLLLCKVWRRRLSGPSLRSIASFQATADSTWSHGRHVLMFGVRRRESDLLNWLVSWTIFAKTNRVVRYALMFLELSSRQPCRIALRAYSMNIRNVAPYGTKPPCRALPFMIAVIPNSRTVVDVVTRWIFCRNRLRTRPHS